MDNRKLICFICLVLFPLFGSANDDHPGMKVDSPKPDSPKSVQQSAAQMAAQPPEAKEIWTAGSVANVRPRLGDRFYVESVLRSVYGPPSIDLTQKEILELGTALGGPCDQYEQVRIGNGADDILDARTKCPNGKSGSRIPMVPNDSVVREGRISYTCGVLSTNLHSLEFAVKQANGHGFEESPRKETIMNAMRLFTPVRKPDPVLVDQLFSSS